MKRCWGIALCLFPFLVVTWILIRREESTSFVEKPPNITKANITKCGCPSCLCVQELHGGIRFLPEVLSPNHSLCVPAQPWLRTMVLSVNSKRFALVRAWLAEVSLVPDVLIGIKKEKHANLDKFFGKDKYTLMTLSATRLLQHLVDDPALGEEEWTLLLEDDAFLSEGMYAPLFPAIVQRALRESASVGWVYLCSFGTWAMNEQPNYTIAFPPENRLIPVYSTPKQSINSVAFIITKWQARKVLESLFRCQEKIIDKCYFRYMELSDTFPTIVFLNHTSRWPGLIGQSRILDHVMRNPTPSSEKDMTEITRFPRSPFLCNSLELMQRHDKNPCFGDRVFLADNVNMTDFLSRFTHDALRSLSDDPDFPPR